MQGLPFVLLFTALTFLSWGAYGPLLRYGTTAMGHDGLKAFVGVGVAYFLIAVLVPFWILLNKGEKGKWTLVGTTYSIIAGSVGAIGALGIILALVFKGSPVFVMPLVFGFAPIVNTLVTAWMGGTLKKISPVFVGGIIAAALGAGGVLYFKPPAKPTAMLTKAGNTTAEPKKSEATNKPKVDTPTDSGKGAASKPVDNAVDKTKPIAPKASEATKPEEPTKPAESPKPAASPVVEKPVAEPTPPVKPLMAARPDDGLPPVPAKPEPALVAVKPDDGQPPKPDEAKSSPTPVAPKSTGADLPPPVVNPESDLPEPSAPAPIEQPKAGEPATSEAPKAEAPKPEASNESPQAESPQVEPTPGKDLPPPVPNPGSEFSAQQTRRMASRFVSTTDVQVRAPWADLPGDNIDESIHATAAAAHHDPATKPNPGMIALSILMAAVCWGSYGPMLHKGQMKMGGSRLRPFACVGIAYFIIAVAVPVVLLYTTPTISQGAWNAKGVTWSIIAGGAGALGALGIILAFNAGGKPIYVMPLVFGFAPVINTFISLTEAGTWSDVENMFWISLGVVIAGAITVLITAPKAAHGPGHAPTPVGAK